MRPIAVALLVLVVIGLSLEGRRVAAQEVAVGVGTNCASAFSAAESSRVFLPGVLGVEDDPHAGSVPGADLDTLGSALVDLTIMACTSSEEWLAAAALYPGALGDGDAEAVLAFRCADDGTGLGSHPTCTSVAGLAASPTPSPLPSVEPGASPDLSESPSPGPSPAPTLTPTPAPTPAAAVALVQRPSVKPKVRGATRTRYYPIRGLSPDELLTQMQVNGTRFCPTHALACVIIQPSIRPLVTTGAACRVIRVEASITSSAFLPRWAGPREVYPELAAWWRSAVRRIGRHESEHIRIAERYLARLRRDLPGKPCSRLQASVNRWSADLQAAQEAFDARDMDRPWPEYDGPTP